MAWPLPFLDDKFTTGCMVSEPKTDALVDALDDAMQCPRMTRPMAALRAITFLS